MVIPVWTDLGEVGTASRETSGSSMPSAVIQPGKRRNSGGTASVSQTPFALT